MRSFSRYLTSDLPIAPDVVETLGGGDPDKAVQAMIEQATEEMYREDPRNEFLEITYQNGDKEITYFKDFSSGAMIENIVRRAKKVAIKRLIETDVRGLRPEDLIDSVFQEFKEHEDLPNTTNPDDWARISGRKGERIVFVRTLIDRDDNMGGKSIDGVTPASICSQPNLCRTRWQAPRSSVSRPSTASFTAASTTRIQSPRRRC